MIVEEEKITEHNSIKKINKNTDIDVSVIIVSYNTRELTLNAIDAAIESITNPEFKIEVIVADNASKDGSCEAISEKFPEVKVLRSEHNLGFGGGNNLAAKHAKGKYLFLLNSDTQARKGSLELLAQALEVEDTFKIAGPFLENPDGSYQNSIMSFPSVWRIFCQFFWLDKIFKNNPFFADSFMLHTDTSKQQCVDVINGAALMIERNVYENMNGFDEDFFMYFEENDLCKRAYNQGFRAIYVPQAKVMHIGWQSSRQKPWWVFKIIRKSRYLYAKKHFNFFNRIAVWTITHTGYFMRIIVFSILGIFHKRSRDYAKKIFLSYIK